MGSRGPGFVVWLAWRGILIARGEALLRVVVGTAAVLLLLVGVALQPTALARSERSAAVQLPVVRSAGTTSGILLAQSDDYFRGNPLQVRRVAVVPGAGSPVGTVPRLPDSLAPMVLPGDGELVASPALADLLRSSAELRSRYPGRLVGLVPDRQLLGPDSLVLWQGAAAADLPPGAGWLAASGTKSSADIASTLPTEIRLAVPLLLVGFVLPLLALLALLATLGSARREARLAALRLVGLSDRVAKAAAVLESGLVAVLATGAGCAFFFAARGWMAAHAPVEGAVWVDDLTVPVAALAAVVLAFPGVSVLASWLGLRAITTSPLGVERRSVRVRPRRWPVLVLVGGLAAALAVVTGLAQDPDTRSRASVIASALVAVGLAGSVPLVVRTAARVAARRTRSLPLLLASRRIEREPGRSTRVSVGLTLLVVMAGPLLIFFPLIADSSAPDLRRLAAQVGTRTLVATQGPDDDLTAPPAPRSRPWPGASAPGVRAAVTVRTVTLGPVTGSSGAEPPALVTALVVDCDDLGAVTGIDPDRCARGLRRPGAEPPGWPGRSVLYAEELVGAEQRVRLRPVGKPFTGPPAGAVPRYAVSRELERLLDGLASPATLLIPAASGPAGPLAGWGRTQLTVPRAAADLETVRTALVRSGASAVLTAGERDALARRETREFELLASLAALMIVLAAALATTVAAVEQLAATASERRLLHLEGAPDAVVRRALVLQAVLPTVLGVVPAVGATVLLAGAFAGLNRELAIAVPVVPIAVLGAVALVVPVLATTAAGRLAGTRSLTVLGE